MKKDKKDKIVDPMRYQCNRCKQIFDTRLVVLPKNRRCTNVLMGDEVCGGKLISEDKVVKRQRRSVQRTELVATDGKKVEMPKDHGKDRTRRGLKKDKGHTSLDMLMFIIGALLVWAISFI